MLSQAPGMSLRSTAGTPNTSTATTTIGASEQPIERQRIGGAAIDQDAAVHRHGPEQAGKCDRGGKRRPQRSG